MLPIVLLTAAVACSVDHLPSPDRVVLSCSGTAAAVPVDGVFAPTARSTEPALLGRSFSELAQAWRGSVIAIATVSGRTRFLTADGRDLAVEIVRGGFGWAGHDDADLRAAEREARMHQRGIWDEGLWKAQRSARTRPIDIPTPAPTTGPIRLGPAARVPVPADSAVWNRRLEEFRRGIEALTAEAADE
jgi:hypothetical protein